MSNKKIMLLGLTSVPCIANNDTLQHILDAAEEAVGLMNEDENKKTYMVHVGLRFVANWKIEAASEEEALKKAELSVGGVESPAGFEFVSDDYDIIQIE